MPVCHTLEPDLYDVSDERVRCLLYTDVGHTREQAHG
jgi:hypothetical protein